MLSGNHREDPDMQFDDDNVREILMLSCVLFVLLALLLVGTMGEAEEQDRSQVHGLEGGRV
jgi:hypothetical protein